MAACLISDKVMIAMQAKGLTFEGVHTCCGHLLGSRVGTLILDYLLGKNLVHNSKQQGEALLQGLEKIKTNHESIGDVRGKGLMCGPPLVITPRQVHDLLAILEEAVGSIEKSLLVC